MLGVSFTTIAVALDSIPVSVAKHHNPSPSTPLLQDQMERSTRSPGRCTHRHRTTHMAPRLFLIPTTQLMAPVAEAVKTWRNPMPLKYALMHPSQHHRFGHGRGGPPAAGLTCHLRPAAAPPPDPRDPCAASPRTAAATRRRQRRLIQRGKTNFMNRPKSAKPSKKSGLGGTLYGLFRLGG